MDGAKMAVEKEQPAWEFEKTKKQAWERWNKELSKIKVETSDDASRKIFYTALYHTMVAPSLFSDVDGAYRGADGKVYNKSRNVYTTMSLWDTYRAAMPLYHIIHPSKRADLINTMLDIFDEQGKLPVWHLMGNETDCMVGNPGVIAVAEAIVKGIEGIDKERAYKACKASVMLDERGQDIRKKYGYIPCDLYEEACANDMEYAIADAAVANAARVLGRHEDEKYFKNRSHSWRNFFDKETQFVRGRTADGGWRTPFNPFSAEHRANDYCEGNAWQYTWLAPHDLKGLLEAFGGREKMTHRLDSLFKAPSVLGKDASPDMSGLIGQYVHGNEPSHHIIYLYTMSGQPWKTADKVREILEGQYHAAPDGLSGNEDVGQMSAWYILTAMGFYNVEPASTKYWFGSPLFDKVSIVVSKDGKTKFDINTVNNSKENKYIQKITLNGQEWDKPYIEYGDIVKGGKLTFYMGAQPAVWYNWETANETAK
jgi:putative alpha-1,2-mannosidase